MSKISSKPKFELGHLVATPNALRHVSHHEILKALARHVRGDWGDLDDEDSRNNDRSLNGGGRIFSAYHAANSVKFWIITEADRSSTCVLLPEDY